MTHPNSFDARATLDVGGRRYTYYRLDPLRALDGSTVDRLPFSLKVLLENLVRGEDDAFVKKGDIEALARWDVTAAAEKEVAYRPARVLLQDFTGVPCVVDLAAMRDAITALGGDPQRINPLQPVDLVIDHSVQVDEYGSDAAFLINVNLEFERNQERYRFLRWGQSAFRNFRVVPPGTGICHQVNLEYLARVAFVNEEGDEPVVYPDSLVGTDSHTTMVNGLGVFGWGVGGIEAEAAMLGQPLSMLVPEVVGFKLTGKLPAGATATDLVLTVTEMLRKKKVVGKFVEFYGTGLSGLPLADRATIANMAPEYGATMGFFPVDDETLKYLRLTGRSDEQIALVEAYAKAQGLFRTDATPDPVYTDALALDLATVEPSIAGPRRPQDRDSAARVEGAVRDAPRRSAREGRHVRRQGRDQGGDAGERADPALAARGRDARGAPGARRRRGRVQRADVHAAQRRGRAGGDHELHEHVEPERDARRRPPRAERGAARAHGEAVGEDVALAGLARRHRLLREGRSHEGPRGGRLLSRRLRLHDVHRQLRAAPRADLERRREGKARGRRGALRQPQLRGARQPAHAVQLPRESDARRRLRARRAHGHRPRPRAVGHRHRRTGLPARHLAVVTGDPGHDPVERQERAVPQAVRERRRRRRAVAGARAFRRATRTRGTRRRRTSRTRRTSRG